MRKYKQSTKSLLIEALSWMIGLVLLYREAGLIFTLAILLVIYGNNIQLSSYLKKVISDAFWMHISSTREEE